MLTVRVPADVGDVLAAALMELGAGGVEQEPEPDGSVEALRVYGRQRSRLVTWARRLRELSAELGLPCSARVGPAPASTAGWDTAWAASLEPVRVSRTLVLAPATAKRVEAPSTHVVLLEPARAFGFGDHPTTRLAAAAVERACRGGARTVLDVGTGTGVLAIVAALSGASRVVGIDVDPEAIATARRNGRTNGAHAHVSFVRTPLARIRETFDLVVANVDYRILLDLSPAVVRTVARGGTLLLTGVLGRHAGDVERCYRELGFEPALRRKTEGGFALLSLSRAGSSARSRGAPPPQRRGTTRKTRSR